MSPKLRIKKIGSSNLNFLQTEKSDYLGPCLFDCIEPEVNRFGGVDTRQSSLHPLAKKTGLAGC